jgi:hypothetical protein
MPVVPPDHPGGAQRLAAVKLHRVQSVMLPRILAGRFLNACYMHMSFLRSARLTPRSAVVPDLIVGSRGGSTGVVPRGKRIGADARHAAGRGNPEREKG